MAKNRLLRKRNFKNKLVNNIAKFINTKDVILDNESPLASGKKGKRIKYVESY